MKKLSILFLMLGLTITIQAQIKDSVIYDSQEILIKKAFDSEKITITNKQTNEQLSDIKFAKRIYNYIQVLDADNNMFFLNDNWEKKETVRDYIGVCGTVPHYTLSNKKEDKELSVYKNETFYDYGDVVPAQKIDAIPHSLADSILFINGKEEFSYTSNFVYSIGIINPETLILKKDGKYFVNGNQQEGYDAIDFSNYYHSLKTKRGEFYGILGLVEPKYKDIAAFDYYLAKASTEKGLEVYIDIEGNEY